MSREDIRAVDYFPASLRVQAQNSQSCRNILMGMQEPTVLSTIGAHPLVNSHKRSLPNDFHKQGGVGWDANKMQVDMATWFPKSEFQKILQPLA